ncbi:MAG: type II secretion system protein N [Pseudomonadota bacterium]
MRAVGLCVLATVVFLGTLVLRVPLDRIHPWLPDGLQNGLRFVGSVSDGSVLGVRTGSGPLDADWVLQPLALMRGQLGADVDFVFNREIEGESRVSVGLGRVLTVRDLRLAADANALDALVLPGILRFGGGVRLNIERAEIAQSQYGPAVGVISWSGASITGQIAVSLGDVRLTLSEVDGGTRADISNSGGEIGLSGSATLMPDGAYQTDVVAVPTAAASPNVVFTLQNIAQAESANRFRIRQSGTLADVL